MERGHMGSYETQSEGRDDSVSAMWQIAGYERPDGQQPKEGGGSDAQCTLTLAPLSLEHSPIALAKGE